MTSISKKQVYSMNPDDFYNTHLPRHYEMISKFSGKVTATKDSSGKESRRCRHEQLLASDNRYRFLCEELNINDIRVGLEVYDLLVQLDFLDTWLACGGQFVNASEIVNNSQFSLKGEFLKRYVQHLGLERAMQVWEDLASKGTITNSVGTIKGKGELRNVLCIRTARFIEAGDGECLAHGDFAFQDENGEWIGVEHKGNQCRLAGQEPLCDVGVLETLAAAKYDKLTGVHTYNPGHTFFTSKAGYTEFCQALVGAGKEAFIETWTEILWQAFAPKNSSLTKSNLEWAVEKCWDNIQAIPERYRNNIRVARRPNKKRNIRKGDIMYEIRETNPAIRYGMPAMYLVAAVQAATYQWLHGFDQIWFELDGRYIVQDWKSLSIRDIMNQMISRLVPTNGFDGSSRAGAMQIGINIE